MQVSFHDAALHRFYCYLTGIFMAHIYVYSPSGAVRNKAGFHRAVRRLQQLGHEVEIDPDAVLQAMTPPALPQSNGRRQAVPMWR